MPRTSASRDLEDVALRSARTIEKWQTDYSNIKRILGEEIHPDEIDEALQIEYRNARERDGVRQRTIKNEIMTLRQIVRFAFKWKRRTGCTTIDLGDVPTFAREDRKGIALSLEEIGKLISESTYGPRYGRLFLAGISSGLRKGPWFGFDTRWLDRNEAWLEVPADAMKGGRALSVPVSSVFVAAVPEIEGLAFPDAATWGTYESWPAWAKKADVRRFTPHDCRRTFATLLAEAGVDEPIVATLLGHSNGSAISLGGSVTRRYLRFTIEALRAATASLDEALAPVLRSAKSLLSSGDVQRTT